MKIYFNDKELDVFENDKSFRYRAIMGENRLTLYFSGPNFIEIPVNSYVVYQGEVYSLEKPENFIKKGDAYYEYTLVLDSVIAKLRKYKVRNIVDRRLKFSLTAKPHEHIQLLVDNLNQRDSGWSVGECIESTEITISYNHIYCFDALATIADQCETEYEANNKVISLKKLECNKDNPLALSYGVGNGFKPGVGRSNFDNSLPVEILFVQGGDRNIDFSKYGSRELLLPKSQELEYEGRIYITDAEGLSIRRKDKAITYNNEDSFDCSENYPKRIGEVSEVVVADAENHFYDIIDTSIPDNLNYEDCIIGEAKMTIIFQSGMLNGREFDVKYYHESVDGKTARRFEIVPAELDGQTMPNETFCPRPEDKYAVFNCTLPDAYICDNETKTGASWDMFREAARYMYENEDEKFTFKGELDGIWSKDKWLEIGGKITLGGYVSFSDAHFLTEPALVRIIGIKDYVKNPHSPIIELSNKPVSGSIATELDRIPATEVEISEREKSIVNYTKRGFRDVRETSKMLQDALLNFSGSINPITVSTMQLVAGDECLQYEFVDDMHTPNDVPHDFVYDISSKQLKSLAGIIQHKTLGIDSVSSSYKASAYKFWNVEAYTSPVLADGSVKYFLYIKAGKESQSATMLLSPTAIAIDDVAGYYHFLVGMLNSEFEGGRSFAPMYGYTEVLPGQVRTKKVVTASGESFFDMEHDAMKLGDRLDFNTKGDGLLRIKGSIVQNEAGDESPIACYRGLFNIEYTYYAGDEVAYDIDGVRTTYRYVYPTPASGKLPTESAYWNVIAAGVKGSDGKDGKDGKDGVDGKDGGQGVPGPAGSDGRTSYFHTKYADDAIGTNMNDNGGDYIGTYVDFISESSSDPTKYTWVRTKGAQGEDGNDGIPGTNGEDGKTSYLHIKYSNDGGQTFSSKLGLRKVGASSLRLTGNGLRFTASNIGEEEGTWMGQYVDYIKEDSKDVWDYKWTKIKGEDGFSEAHAYRRSASKPATPTDLKIPPSGWSNTPPTAQATVTIDWEVSSEEGYDYLVITNKSTGEVLLEDSGEYTGTIDVVLTRDSELEFKFSKDSSEEAGMDNARVRISNSQGVGKISYVPNMWTEDEQGYYVSNDITDDEITTMTAKITLTESNRIWCCIGERVSQYKVRAWNEPVLWNGQDGKDGDAGDFTEYRYAVNGSRTAPPALNTTATNPTGWSTRMPVVGSLQYLWSTIAKKKGNGTLMTAWSIPVRMNGSDGKDGEPGPAMAYQGIYDPTKTYYGNSKRVDGVKYNSQYYVARTDAGTFVNKPPTDEKKWNTFGANFESVATGLLLAEKATIVNLVVQEVLTQSGKVKIENDGSITAIDAVIKGFLEATAGKIGNFEIRDGAIVGDDAQGAEKLRLSTGVVENISMIKNPQKVLIDEQRFEEGWENVQSYESRIVTKTCTVTLNENCNIEYFAGFQGQGGSEIPSESKAIYGKTTLQIFRGDDFIKSWSKNETSQTMQLECEVGIDTILLPAGTYTFIAKYDISGDFGAEQDGYPLNGGLDLQGVLWLYREPNIKMTHIGLDGLYSAFSSSVYFYFKESYGIELRFGNYGLQLTSGGLKKMTNGSTWVTL